MPDTDSFARSSADLIKSNQLQLFDEPVQIEPPGTPRATGKRPARRFDAAATPLMVKRPRRMSAAQAVRRVRGKSKLYNAVDADLTRRGIPFVRVCEAAKALKHMGRMKHFDFVVYRAAGDNWLVLCKRRNWGIEMKQWEEVFGKGYKSVIASRGSTNADAAQAGETIVYRDLNGLPVDPLT